MLLVFSSLFIFSSFLLLWWSNYFPFDINLWEYCDKHIINDKVIVYYFQQIGNISFSFLLKLLFLWENRSEIFIEESVARIENSGAWKTFENRLLDKFFIWEVKWNHLEFLTRFLEWKMEQKQFLRDPTM